MVKARPLTCLKQKTPYQGIYQAWCVLPNVIVIELSRSAETTLQAS